MKKSLRKSIEFTCPGLLFCLFCLLPACGAQVLGLPDTAYQGDLIFGGAPPGARVRLDDRWLAVGPNGYFVIAVPRDRQKDLRVTASDRGRKTSRTVRVWAYPWKKQYITGLAERYVSPGSGERQRIRKDARRIRAVRDSAPYPVPLFLKRGFQKPVRGKVTSVFGSQRFLNGIPRSPHAGIDIAAPLGTPVRSPADGIARLVAENMFLTGNTLLVDHGLGVSSIFIHLSRIDVQVGDLVRQGDVIAAVGKSGRATGPHLHWGVSVGPVAVDPLRLLERSFNPARR